MLSVDRTRERSDKKQDKRQSDTLLIEANMALAYLDSKETTESEPSQHKRRDYAYKAYQSIKDRLPAVNLLLCNTSASKRS